MAYDVFISHSIRNKDVADAVCDRLEAAGVRCWMAPRDILPGREWGEAIMNGIKQSHIFLLVFSSHANASKQVLREVERAASRDMVLLPVRVEDVEPSAGLEYYISTSQWLDAISPPLERHLEHVVQTVGRLLERPEPAPRRAAVTPAPGPGRPPEPVRAARQTARVETARFPAAAPGDRATPDPRAAAAGAGRVHVPVWSIHPNARRAARTYGSLFLILGAMGGTGFFTVDINLAVAYLLFGVCGVLAGFHAGTARAYHSVGAVVSAIVVVTGIASFFPDGRSLVGYPWMLLHAGTTLGMSYFGMLHDERRPAIS